MEKLELKHIAPYLPYGLKTKYFLSDAIVLNEGQPEDIRDKNLTSDNVNFVLSFCKPILYPLSWLTKEIECNDSQFIPSKTLMRLSRNDNFEYSLTFAFIRMLKLDIEQGNERDLINDLNNAPYWVIQKLIEWHFNVFNLPEHLYIDKSTLKDNGYKVSN